MQMEEIRQAAEAAVRELLAAANMRPGELFVVGCSSSEILGSQIGKGSSPEAAQAVFEGIYPVLQEKGIFLAAQCCEHLNRALILERAAAGKFGYDPVNVCPWAHGGGSFATVTFQRLSDPVAVEHIRAHAGIDIGDTLIGMHLRDVAVPVRISVKRIGEASVVCARTRMKFIGGERARYLGGDLR